MNNELIKNCVIDIENDNQQEFENKLINMKIFSLNNIYLLSMLLEDYNELTVLTKISKVIWEKYFDIVLKYIEKPLITKDIFTYFNFPILNYENIHDGFDKIPVYLDNYYYYDKTCCKNIRHDPGKVAEYLYIKELIKKKYDLVSVNLFISTNCKYIKSIDDFNIFFDTNKYQDIIEIYTSCDTIKTNKNIISNNNENCLLSTNNDTIKNIKNNELINLNDFFDIKLDKKTYIKIDEPDSNNKISFVINDDFSVQINYNDNLYKNLSNLFEHYSNIFNKISKKI